MASLKSRVDNMDVDKLKTVPADLSKLNNVVGNDVIRKNWCCYEKLFIKVNAIDTKIPSTSGIVIKT